MTDNEIAICKETIEDLHTYCFLTSATYKPMGFEFSENDFIRLNNLIDLINRQKAEIEMLKKQIVLEVDRAYDRGEKSGAKVAVKEFAEKVKGNCEWFFGYNISRNKLIDGLVKEMTEESNDQQKT